MQLKVRSVPEVYIFATVVSVVTCTLVALMTPLFYPIDPVPNPPSFAFILICNLLVTLSITFMVCIWGGYQLLEMYRLSQILKQLVERDKLTDAATRDHFFRRIQELEGPAGVSLMIDIDLFKSVNDTFGHLAGDQVIRRVADVLKSNVRRDDIVCRFGGEEFVLFLPGATPEEGWAIAERIRADVADQVVEVDEARIEVTTSIGGSIKGGTEPIDASLKRADQCLYRAKATGRNKCVAFIPPLEEAVGA